MFIHVISERKSWLNKVVILFYLKHKIQTNIFFLISANSEVN